MIAPLALLLALGPWVGRDLPTGAPDTIKYKLTVSGDPGREVKLRSGPVPKDWIASFCTPRVCAPFKTTIVLAQDGIATIEFQLIPPDGNLRRQVFTHIDADDGVRRTSVILRRSDR